MTDLLLLAQDRSIFTANILLLSALMMIPLEKRRHFWPRAVLGAAACLAFSLVFPHSVVKYVVELLAVGLAFVFFSCAISLPDAAYCMVCAYAVQHFASALYMLVLRSGRGAPAFSLVYLVCCGVPYALFYFFFARKMPESGHYHVDIKFSLISTALVLITALWLSEVAGDIFNRDGSPLYYVCKAYAMLCCFFVLWVQVAQKQKLKAQQALSLQQQIWKQQRAQYELSRKNIEVINRKCHDLKHQVSALRSVIPEREREDYLDEIERSIQIYDSTITIETGNEVLDTVLTEKSLYCEQHQITMTCVADGSKLGFLDGVDVYAIFGNALDNAIESVSKVPEPEKRLIAVSVWSRSGLLLIQVENYFEGTLAFEDGLPVTSKEDKDYHGFGIKSIRYAVEKYDGCMGIYPENNLFLLRISIPIP